MSAAAANTTPAAASPRVLVIDDNRAIHRDFEKILTGSAVDADLAASESILFGGGAGKASSADGGAATYRVDFAEQGELGLARVVEGQGGGDPFALAFVDMRMPPGWDGLRTIEAIWARDPDVQVVICTAYSDYSWDDIRKRLGTSDRLLILKKPFDNVEVTQLASALTTKWTLERRAKSRLAELEELVRERTAELRRAALQDKLTGLPNRSDITQRLDELIRKGGEGEKSEFALVFLDCDRFKVINDSLGHTAGDELLVSIAGRIRAVLCEPDTAAAARRATAARLGGDEFVILLEGIGGADEFGRVAHRVLAALGAPYRLGGVEVFSTASAGITTSAIGYRSAGEMIRDADTAMYRAKSGGGSRCVTFDRQMHEAAIARLTTENDLRKAVAAGELVLHYQPVICLRDRRLTGFEALLRWNHPTRGMVPPGEFIPVAEETGLIVPIGKWVLEEACRQLAAWRVKFPTLAELGVSVNVSARQLAHPEMASHVARVVKECGLEPRRLALEITESAIVHDTEQTLRVLGELRALGVGLEIDDFGTGYSALSYLHRFPLSGLKIDGSFVNSMSERRDYAAVVHAIVTLAHNLNMTLTAEGVELAEQVAMLQAMDCDFAQGFHFAKAADAAAATRLVEQAARDVARACA